MATSEAGAATTAEEAPDFGEDTVEVAPQFAELKHNLKAWGGEGKPDTLLRRLNKVMAEVGTIPKSAKHREHQYMFSSVDDVLSAVRPLFARIGIYHNLCVVSRDYKPFNTSRGGVGYNGNMTYLLTLFNSDDPEEFIAWEIAGLVTNPGEKLDWVAASQFLKFGLVTALLLDRGEDADTSPSEGPTNARDAMRSRSQGPPQRRPDGPPPSSGGSTGLGLDGAARNKGWEPAWQRVIDTAAPPKNDAERVTKSSIDNIYIEGAKLGWADDMVRVEVRRKLGVELVDISWTIADRLAWIFGHFPADKYFVPPSSDEAAEKKTAEAAEPGSKEADAVAAPEAAKSKK